MPDIQPEIVELNSADAHGAINSACRFDDHDGQRFIQIHGKSFYIYDLNDSVSERFVCIQLHLTGYARLTEIAKGFDIPLRSLHHWKTSVMRGGLEALLPKAIPGRPRTVTTTIKRQVLRCINQGKTHEQICKQFNLSGSSIDRIVAEEKGNHQMAVQTILDEESFLELPLPEGASHVAAETSQTQNSLDYLNADCNSTSEVDSNSEATLDESDFDSSLPVCDPLNRSLDRTMARIGLLEDAEPLFAPGRRLDCMGFFMIVALLSSHPVLSIFERIYGKTLAPAFYGLRTTVMILLMMALLRIKRPENLRQYNPANLARVLGLDRVMEVKTLRRKLQSLAGLGRGTELMDQLGRARLEGVQAPTDGALELVYIDGHVQCYHGHCKIGQTWSATRNRTVKGRTDTWLHLPGQTPLFYLESPFNESLGTVIEKHRTKIEEVFGSKPVLVFDREGWDLSFLDKLDREGWKFITYRKGNYEALPVERFKNTTTTIGKRSYAHSPVDIGEQCFNLYEKTIGKSGKPSRRKIGVKVFREVRVLSDDRGHQTAIVTNLCALKTDAVAICASLFERWGNQENVFKYMKQEFDLDALLEYNQGDKSSSLRAGEETVPAGVDHPDPRYGQLTREIKDLCEKQTGLLAKYGVAIEKQTGDRQSAQLDEEQLTAAVAAIGKIRAGSHGRQLESLTERIEQLRVMREQCEVREEVAPAGYSRLRSGAKLIADAIKMSAYDLESELFEMLGPYYPNRDKEGRKLIASALRGSGSLRLENGRIAICLEEQTSPNRTAAIDALCRQLNQRQATFPGTDLRIEFETSRPD